MRDMTFLVKGQGAAYTRRSRILSDMPTKAKPLEHPAAFLAARAAEGLLRQRAVLDSPQGAWVVVDGERLLSFCSNDYLGLANHPDVIAALQAAAARYGVGAGASHLLSGHSREHHALEEELADFVGAPRALLFSTGYMANIGVLAGLAERGYRLYEDKLNHASLIDAARLAGAKVHRYPHADAAWLARRGAAGPGFIATDGVFSMDGDLAPLPVLADLARAANLRVLVDDAHGVGVVGAGRGTLAHFQLALAPPFILMGTLGKAFGTFGAFVAAEADLIEALVQRARTYIYTTALPPAIAAATRAALNLVRREAWRRERLQALIAQFKAGASQAGITLLPSDTPIQPVLLGDAQRAVAVSAALRTRGLWVPAIRPPTVPANGARLRVSLSAAHTEADVARLLEALAAALATPPA